jgi:hypothetical protein
MTSLPIALPIIARVARSLPAPERRALLWLTNYARLLDLPQEALAAALRLDPGEIRRALTDPACDRAAFVRAIAALRQKFEAGLKTPRAERKTPPPFKSKLFRDACGPLANTKIARKVTNAIRFAARDREPQIVEIIGRTRLGKSIAAAHEYFRRLDHAVWIVVPPTLDERSFYLAFANALGIAASSADRNSALAAQIESCLGPDLISLAIVEEAHRNWPAGPRRAPRRLDHWRDWWEYHSLASVHLSTPQAAQRERAVLLRDDARWEIGQWIGRRQCFDLPATMDDADLEAVARCHAPAASRAALDQLISHAKTSRGYAGVIARTVERATFKLAGNSSMTLLEAIKDAQKQIDRELRIEAAAGLIASSGRATPAKRARQFNIIEMEAAA